MPKKEKKTVKGKDKENGGAKQDDAATPTLGWTCEECGQENDSTEELCCACEAPHPKVVQGTGPGTVPLSLKYLVALIPVRNPKPLKPLPSSLHRLLYFLPS